MRRRLELRARGSPLARAAITMGATGAFVRFGNRVLGVDAAADQRGAGAAGRRVAPGPGDYGRQCGSCGGNGKLLEG